MIKKVIPVPVPALILATMWFMLSGCGNRTGQWQECGNGTIGSGEECDGSNLGGQTCESLGFSGGTLSCTGSCIFDTSGCGAPLTCGNGSIEPPEECDGTNLGGQTCEGLGYSGGTLACTGSCRFDTSGCGGSGDCGNGSIDAGEDCDGTNLGGATCVSLGHTGGTLDCRGDCSFDESGCEDDVPSCVRYVNVDSTAGSPDGLSWATAFQTVQAGIDAAHAAAPSGGRCDVWVAEGIYVIFSSGSPDETVQLQPGVDVYGGFTGSETSRAARDWEVNITTLDGRQSGGSGRVQHVVTGADDAVIDGFRIMGGSSPDYGGGILCWGVATTVRNCEITENIARTGGGIFLNTGSPTISNCLFWNNESEDGGGAIFSDMASPTITGCTFSSHLNGSVRVQGGNPVIERCEFSSSAAGLSSFYSTVTVSDSTFEGHTYGAVRVFETSTVDIRGCTFTDNRRVTTGVVGGAIGMQDSTVTVMNSIFTGNTSCRGGAIHVYWDSDLTVTNSVFIANVSEYSVSVSGGGYGGAIFVDDTATVINSTFYGNTVTHDGGAIFASTGTSLDVRNCVAWGNTPNGIYGGITAGTTTIEYTLTQETRTGAGNISTDPQFFSPPERLDLLATSPCIDAANGDIAPGRDMADNARVDVSTVPNTGAGTPDYVDMGAYEFQP